MTFDDFKQYCIKQINVLGLDKETYIDRLYEELHIIEAELDDYKSNPIDYFLGMSEHARTNGKIPNTNNLLLSYVLGITDEDPLKTEKDLSRPSRLSFLILTWTLKTLKEIWSRNTSSRSMVGTT